MERDGIPSVGDYLIMWVLLCIPIVNIVFLIVWAIGGSSTPEWKINFARAYWVVLVVSFLLGIAFWGIFAAALGSAMRF
ncbi:MAG: hypothetical protein FWG20_03270 [Candidatus Cloacimonetes bacterium]|nr:hypothetical protein [Candidatus Cloacimonadota bacterium]